MSRVWHQLNSGAVRELLQSPDGGVARDMLRRGLQVETKAKQNLAGGASGPARIDSGRLRSSITTTLNVGFGTLAVRVGTDVWYAILVHNGTGIYGPSGTPIRPVSAKVLVFTPKGSGQRVFAREVSGMEPNRFLTDALSAARD